MIFVFWPWVQKSEALYDALDAPQSPALDYLHSVFVLWLSEIGERLELTYGKETVIAAQGHVTRAWIYSHVGSEIAVQKLWRPSKQELGRTVKLRLAAVDPWANPEEDDIGIFHGQCKQLGRQLRRRSRRGRRVYVLVLHFHGGFNVHGGIEVVDAIRNIERANHTGVANIVWESAEEYVSELAIALKFADLDRTMLGNRSVPSTEV